MSFKIGEEVLVNTGQGWMKGTILSANGNVYRIHTQIGIDTTKIYPDEIRRTGPPTAKDRAAGQCRHSPTRPRWAVASKSRRAPPR